jgi:HD-GYP domain-containing protein (c-di-GMP phosphodiesterase class II)
MPAERVQVASKMGSAQQRDRDAQTQRSRVWDRRPALSHALRVAVFAGPIAGSFGVAALLSHVLPRADSVGTRVLWTTVIIAASLVTLVALERAARQLLPLAALLNLSLTFPDKAPARFALARRTGKPSDLRASLKRARESGHDDDARRMQTVIELVLALSVYDPASRGHSERVRVFTDLLTKELKIPESGRNRLRWAALLHDIGKLEVPWAILKKPGKPTEEEWISLHRHPEEGARLVAPLLPWLGEWGLAVVQHHERFDGTGYPNRLKGHEISLGARIVSVADSYEVMTAPRNYKRQMSVSAARQELVRVAGTQFDPAIVRAFLNISLGRLWRTIGFGAWIAQVPTVGRLFSFGGFGGVAGPIAAAAAATVLAVAGVIGPAPGPSVTGPAGRSPAVASAPSQGAAPTLPNQPGFGPTPTVTGPRPAASGAPGSTVAPTGGPTPAPGATTTPIPTSRPTAAPGPGPTPTPAPTPDPWSCAACTNTSPGCTSYCSGTPNAACITYCIGNNNKVCTSHCFGNNNQACLDYCKGNNNPLCVPPNPNCRNAAVIALAAGEIRAPGLLPTAAVGARIYARPPPAVPRVAAFT